MRYELGEFIEDVFRIAQEHEYKIKTNYRSKLKQIDFGVKKLRLDHIKKLYPDALFPWTNINKLIETVAPGRPCAHKPFRKIIEQLHKEKIGK